MTNFKSADKNFQNLCCFVCLAYEVNVHIFYWNKKHSADTDSSCQIQHYLTCGAGHISRLRRSWTWCWSLFWPHNKYFVYMRNIGKLSPTLFGDFGILMVCKIRCAKFRVDHFFTACLLPHKSSAYIIFSRWRYTAPFNCNEIQGYFFQCSLLKALSASK